MTGWKAYILILSVSLVVAYGLYLHVDYALLAVRRDIHQDIIHGTAPSPYQYRFLVPAVTEVIARTLTPLFGLGYDRAFLLTYALYDVGAIFALLAVLFIWLKIWFSPDHSLIGTLFVAATMPLAVAQQNTGPWSLLEPTLFCLALLAIYRQRFWPLVGLMVVGTLNRETAVFMALAYLLCSRWERRTVVRFVLLLLVWAVVYLGLRLARGNVPHIYTLAEIWAASVSYFGLRMALINVPLFLGGFWLFALLGLRRAPLFIRHAAWLIPVYILVLGIWSNWYETRWLMTLYPLLVPLGLCYVESV